MDRNISSAFFRIVVLILFIFVAYGVTFVPGMPDSTNVTLPYMDDPVKIPEILIILVAICFAYATLISCIFEKIVLAVLSCIPFVGSWLCDKYMKHMAGQAEGLPSQISRLEVAKNFAEAEKNISQYVSRLTALQNSGEYDAQTINSLHIIALSNLVYLARGIVNDYPPQGVVANVMQFDSEGDRLIVISSTEIQSFDSIVGPWNLERRKIPDPELHPGICVRAFRQNRIVIKNNMEKEASRAGDPIAAMISIPLCDIAKAEDRDLAILNVNSFVHGYIPERLSRIQKERISIIKMLAADINVLHRRLKLGGGA